MEDRVPPTGGRDTPDVPDVGTLVEAYSRGKGELIGYLREHETAEYLIGLVVAETGLKRLYVRAAYNILVGLLVDQGEAGAKRLASRLAKGSARLLSRLPFYDRIARALLGLEERLRCEEGLKERLDAMFAGRLGAAELGDEKNLSREARIGLRALREQEALWAEVDRGFDEVLGRLNPRPPLTTRVLSAEAGDLPVNHLRFNTRRIPLVGRAVELDALEGFLGAERRFCWWLVTGPGGLGKSRIALELCLRRSVEWRAGFLRREASYDSWDMWQPEAKTLIVLDYVGSQVERARQIITALRDREHELDAPVRLLLLERQATGQEWWRSLIGPDATGAEIRDSCFRPDGDALQLDPLGGEELWATVRFVLESAHARLPDRDATLQELRRIDPECRPLFAALAAVALAAGRSLRGWDRGHLLADVLARERARMWPPDVTPAEMNLLALATMCGPLPVAEAERLGGMPHLLPLGFLPDFDPDAAGENAFRPRRYAQMVGRALDNHPESSPQLPPLEPDILGEFFVLRHLMDEDGVRVLHRRAERLRHAARAATPDNARAFSQFIARCADDFLDEPALNVLAEPPDDLGAGDAWHAWGPAALGLIEAFARAGRVDEACGVCEKMSAFAASRPEDVNAQRKAGVIALKLMPVLIEAGRMDEARTLHERLACLSAGYPDDADLRWVASGAATPYALALIDSGENLADAVTMFGDLAEAASRFPTEAELRLQLTVIACRLLAALIERGRIDEAWTVHDRLAGLIAVHPEEVAGQDLRPVVALNASELLHALLGMGRIQEARAVGDELKALAVRWPISGVLMNAAHVALQLIVADVAAGRLEDAWAAHIWLTELSDAHPDNADLRFAGSGAGRQVAIALARAGRAEDARLLWDTLIASAVAHPEELEPRLSLLMTSHKLVQALEDAGCGYRMEEFDDRLARLAEPRPTIAELRVATGSTYLGLLIKALANDCDFVLQPHGIMKRLLVSRKSDIDGRLTSASGALDMLIELTNFGIRASPDLAAAWHLRGAPEQEAELRVYVARGAAAVIDALLAHGRTEEAAAIARRAETFIRSPEFEAHMRVANGEDAQATLLQLLAGLSDEGGKSGSDTS